jgi:DNA-binding transcriptional MocR family regulator
MIDELQPEWSVHVSKGGVSLSVRMPDSTDSRSLSEALIATMVALVELAKLRDDATAERADEPA